jgi:two-component system C4-dicarboxylate transport response regulator DctD
MTQEAQSKKRILFVSDKDQERGVIKRLLEGEGYDIQTVSSAAEAIGILGDSAFGLVITENRMAEMDGIELLKRKMEIAPKTPFIMVTAYGTVELAVEAMRLGAYDFIEKPYTFEKLILSIRRALESAAASG